MNDKICITIDDDGRYMVDVRREGFLICELLVEGSEDLKDYLDSIIQELNKSSNEPDKHAFVMRVIENMRGGKK